MKRKGFTLIELIVVMGILAILILLAMPKYKEYTNEARLTRIKVNVKELENASSTYYMKNNDWPRLSDEPYSSEQIEDFGKQILDKTGKVVVLEEDGNYYDIDYIKLKNYIKKPNDGVNYILQNPVGKVFFIEGITEEAKGRIPKDEGEIESPEEPETPENIIFKGLSSGAFDKDNTTTSGLGTVTWEGNLDNKKVTIDMVGGRYTTGHTHLKIYDVSGKQLNFINLKTNTEVDVISTEGWNARLITEIIVPEGAVKFVISNSSTDGLVNDIYVTNNLETPSSVYDITSSSTDSSITLNWKQDESNYDKVVIYRNGKFLKIVEGKTFTDTPLYSDTEYVYSFKAVNSYGNASTGLVTYVTKTSIPIVIFNGLSPAAFDKDITTVSGLGTVTWEGDLSNKKVIIDMAGGNYTTGKNNFKIFDIAGKQLNFINLTTNTEVNVVSTEGYYAVKKSEIIVPESAVKFVFSGQGTVRDVYIGDNLESPTPVYDVTSTSTDSSVTLNWKQDDSNYDKTAIYRNGVFLKIVKDKTFIDTPLYSDTEYTYTLKAINSYGNSSIGLVSYTTSTLTPEIIFRGLGAAAFDKDIATASGLGTITWEGNLGGKQVIIDMAGGNYTTGNNHFKIYDIAGNQLKFLNLSTNTEVNVISTDGYYAVKKSEIKVPESAVKFVFSGQGTVRDVYVIE